MIGQQLVAGLLLWTLLSLGTALFGLYVRPREFWHAFWFMSGLWGLVDGGIAWFSVLGKWPDPATLAPILRINAGLDLLYIAAGLVLLSRAKTLLKGFGLAVLTQGFFLLLFDGYFWWRCAHPAG